MAAREDNARQCEGEGADDSDSSDDVTVEGPAVEVVGEGARTTGQDFPAMHLGFAADTESARGCERG